jgi:nitrite reductase/ring-hydroxylating ferredoxin subunit
MPEFALPLAAVPATLAAGDLTIAVFAHDARYYAIDDKCPHRGAPLSKGLQDGADIICPLHHFRFGLETGQCRVPKSMFARVFPARVDGDRVIVTVP